MRFSAIHIDSFGEFTEFSFDEIPPGLSVVIGDNEAGKTTILNFIRSILFGFPKRNQKAYYPPRNAGRKRGRILLLDDKNQTTIVERVEGKGVGPLKVAFPDGSEGGETALKQLIGSATGDLYQNVFAFSLTELQSLEALQNEAVRDAIYSAGIGTGRLTIPQALIRDLHRRITD
jgi:uncharacterized protein YhaN